MRTSPQTARRSEAAGQQEAYVQVLVSARHTEVARRDHDIIVEKMKRVGSKYLPMDRAEIHFSEERNPRIADKEVCEITMEGHGHHVRCKAGGPDHLTAVDRAIDKLENNLRKLKSKVVTHRTHKDNSRAKLRSNATTELPPDLVEEVLGGTNGESPLEDTFPFEIVKTKRVERLELLPRDAAMRMELVDHDFYFFINAETQEAAVVYRRDDGDVGLIDQGV